MLEPEKAKKKTFVMMGVAYLPRHRKALVRRKAVELVRQAVLALGGGIIRYLGTDQEIMSRYFNMQKNVAFSSADARSS